MFKLESGVMDRTRLISNILMVVLLAGNIFFSIQYTQNILMEKTKLEEAQAKEAARYQDAKLLKGFINTVINTSGPITIEDRIKLENDIRQSHDVDVIKYWENFAASKDGQSAQNAAVKLMVLLSNKMI